MLNTENNTYSLDAMPNEILLQIINCLTEDSRKQLAKTSRKYFDFIQTFYTDTLYGKLFLFLPFLEKQLNIIVQQIHEYQKSQQIAFFNLRRNGLSINSTIVITAFGALTICIQCCRYFYAIHGTPKKMLNRYFHTIHNMASKIEIEIEIDIQRDFYTATIITCIFLFYSLFRFYMLRASMQDAQIRLARSSLDQYAIDRFYQLIEKYPFLSYQEELALPLNRLVTFQSVFTSLENACSNIKQVLPTLAEYHASLLGREIKEIKLDRFNRSQEFIIKNCLEEWNNSNTNKCILYADEDENTTTLAVRI